VKKLQKVSIQLEKESHGNKTGCFKNKGIRRIIHDGEWWFTIVDNVQALAESAYPRQYLKRMR